VGDYFNVKEREEEKGKYSMWEKGGKGVKI
jgi:hypothetical protein